MSIMNKLLAGTALATLISFSAHAQQIQGLNSNVGLICSGCTISNPTITGGTIDNTPIGQTVPAAGAFTALSASSTVSGSGFSNYLASPPAIGGTTAAAGTFAKLISNFGGLYSSGSASGGLANSLLMDYNGGTVRFFNLGANSSTNPTGGFNWAIAHSDVSSTTNWMALGNTGILSVSSGLANSVTIAGSAGNPTIGTTASNLTLASAGQAVSISGSSAPGLIMNNSGAGTDLKNYYISNSGNFAITAANDGVNSTTNAYIITRGTTYNVASHTWYTSTVAGTPVQGLQLTPTALNVSSGINLNVAGLSASSATCTDGSKNISTSCSGIVPAVTLNGTSGSIGGGALLAGACSSGTTTVTGATTSMVALADPNTYPGDGAYWDAYVSSANTVTVKVCATVALTPTASTYNVRILQ